MLKFVAGVFVGSVVGVGTAVVVACKSSEFKIATQNLITRKVADVVYGRVNTPHTNNFPTYGEYLKAKYEEEQRIDPPRFSYTVWQRNRR